MGTISYPHSGMGIKVGIIFFREYKYGIELSSGYIPVAIPTPPSGHAATTVDRHRPPGGRARPRRRRLAVRQQAAGRAGWTRVHDGAPAPRPRSSSADGAENSTA